MIAARPWERIALAIAALVALAPHGALAADPPGFPSTPAAGAAPAATVGPASQEDAAKQRIAGLKKFAREHEADAKFAQHEDSERACKIDHGAQLVVLTFNADGVLHCKLDEVAEGYQLDVWVLTVKDIFSGPNHYRIKVTPGAPLKSVDARGSTADVKAMIELLGGAHEDFTEADWWHAPVHYGPYHFDSGTINVALDEAGVAEDTKFTIAPLYSVNLAVLGLVGPGTASYSVVNGMIAESLNHTDITYYFGVHAYPFSWNRNGSKSLRPGRYFSDAYTSWYDRLSVVAGINLAHPTEGGYLGGAIELYEGISITGGWQPRKHAQLQSGSSVGQMITGDQVPTDSVWKLSGWGIGLSVDSTLIKPLLSLAGH